MTEMTFPAKDTVDGPDDHGGKEFLPRSASHSLSLDQRRCPETFPVAIATAFFCPTSTTSFLPRVTAV